MIKSSKLKLKKSHQSGEQNCDTELTPECKYWVGCILNILIESIEKLQIAFGILYMLENCTALSEQWPLEPDEEIECLMFLTAVLKHLQEANSTASPTLDYHLHKLIDLLHRKSAKTRLSLVIELKDEDKELLCLFNELFDVTDQRLKKSPVSELNREKIIDQLRHEHVTLCKNIAICEKQLKTQDITTRWQLAIKAVLIQKYEEDLAIKKWDNNVRIKQVIVKSAKRINDVHSTSLTKQTELKLELAKVKSSYEITRQKNLQQERKARDDKNDLLLQLQTLIKKFDQTIGDKMKESMFEQDAYDEKKRQFDEFLKEFEREELEYLEIVRQKKEEERCQHQQRVLLFMMNRAARNVQRYWRKYRRDLKKKSKKKGKGKKKG